MLDYSRFARYWLPAKATNQQPTTKYQQPTTVFLFIDILLLKNNINIKNWSIFPYLRQRENTIL